MPVLVHTGSITPFSSPTHCLEIALEFQELRIVFVHSGQTIFAEDALIIAKQASNIYLESSRCSSVNVLKQIRALGASRIMMGTDLPTEAAFEIAKIRTLGLSNGEVEQVMSQTALDVFGLRNRAIPILSDPAV